MATTILVIEDDPVTQDILVDFLSANGFVVTVAGTAAEGLAEFSRNKPALAIVDVQLPGRSGFDICIDLKRSCPDVPVMLMSASYSSKDQSSRSATHGAAADAHIAKPFDLRALAQKVNELTARRPAASSDAVES